MIPLFGKFTYLAAPAGDDTSHAGGGAGEGEGTPDPQGGGDAGEGGGEDDPPADDDASGDEPDDPANPEGGKGKDNAIPYSRVKKMLAERETRARTEAENAIRAQFEQRFQTFITKFEQRFGHEPSETDRENAVRVLLGKKPVPGESEEANRPVTMKDIAALFQNQNQQITQAFQLRREEAEVETALTSARAQHSDFFEDDPEFEDRLLDLYRVSPEGATMRDVIAKEVKRMTTFAERRTANYAKRKLTSGRVAPFSRGTAPRTGQPKKFDLSKPDQQDAAVDDLLDSLEAEG